MKAFADVNVGAPSALVFGGELTCMENIVIFQSMSNVEEIEEAVERLSSKEFSIFRTWFSTYDAARWDAEVEIDIVAGKLDSLADEALCDYRSGAARPL
ncbi:MAG: hypothetical protein QM627_02835 [Luteolibacter sp.]